MYRWVDGVVDGLTPRDLGHLVKLELEEGILEGKLQSVDLVQSLPAYSDTMLDYNYPYRTIPNLGFKLLLSIEPFDDVVVPLGTPVSVYKEVEGQ